MKGIQKILILVVILAVLLGAVLAIQQKKASEGRDIRLGQTTAMFPDLEAEQVFRIEIVSLEYDSLLLRKNAGVWEVAAGRDPMNRIIRQGQESVAEGEEAVEIEDPREDPGPAGDPYRTFYKADMEKVQPMIDTIAGIQKGLIVTSDPNQKSNFGVLGLIGTEITLFDGQMNPTAAIIIGNPAEAYTSTYVRKPDEDDIHVVTGRLQMIYQTSLIDLRDRAIFDESPASIASVTVQDFEAGSSLNLSRSEGAWIGTDGAGIALELDPAKVDDLVSSLGSLSANSFVDPNAPPDYPPTMPTEDNPDGTETEDTGPYGFLRPTKIIEFTTAGNESFVLTVGKLEGSTYFAVVGGNFNDVLKISKVSIDGISPAPESLAPGAESEANAQVIGADRIESGELVEGSFEEIPPEVLEQMGQ